LVNYNRKRKQFISEKEVEKKDIKIHKGRTKKEVERKDRLIQKGR
jgi:hypothetical protein